MEDNCLHCGEDLVYHHHRNLKCRGRETVFQRAEPADSYVQTLALATGGIVTDCSHLPDGSGFAVISIPRKPLLQRLRHYLFDCPTVWQWQRAFTCPLCGAKYRCYWNGHDSDCGAGTSLCGNCERQHEGHTPNQCREAEVT